jgi:DNA-binding PadR family transcriptional regulator
MAPSKLDVLDERILLLLGLLTAQSQHGYQINEFIEHNLARVSGMRKATAYSLLARLAEAGLVESTEEQAGNRPVRHKYSLLPPGRDLFRQMLVAILGHHESVEPTGDIALMFIDHLGRDEALRTLRQRMAQLDEQIATLEATPVHGAGIGVDLSIGRRLAMLKADRAWFDGALAQIERDLPVDPTG